MSESDDSFDDFSSDRPVLVGVWSDRTPVHRGRGEFTIDVVRHVPRPAVLEVVRRAEQKLIREYYEKKSAPRSSGPSRA